MCMLKRQNHWHKNGIPMSRIGKVEDLCLQKWLVLTDFLNNMLSNLNFEFIIYLLCQNRINVLSNILRGKKNINHGCGFDIDKYHNYLLILNTERFTFKLKKNNLFN